MVVLVDQAGWEAFARVKAHRLRDRLLEATTPDIPAIVQQMAPFRGWVDPLLHDAYARAEHANDRRRQLHASLALAPVDSDKMDYVYNRLLRAEPLEVIAIREVLFDRKQDIVERLWTLLENRQSDQDQRFHAACALAAFAPNDPRWAQVGGDVAVMLVIQKPFVIAQWTAALKDVGRALLPPLADMLVDEQRSVAERGLIATVYGAFAAETPEAYLQLENQLAEKSASEASADANIALAKRQASIGAALLVMGRGEKAWPLFTHRPDPTMRSYLIERMAPSGVDARLLLARLDEEKETSIRRALLLSLGEYGLDRLPPAERQNLLPRMLDLYRNDPDPGIHGAARWLLKQWKADEKIKEIDLASRVASAPGVRRWSVNGQGQTMVLIPKPREGVFWMGDGTKRHRQAMGHDFSMSADNVTVEQFQRFRSEYKFDKSVAPTRDCPAIEVSWYDAAAYCNWLSQQEGIAEAQWCYEPNKDGKYAEGMKTKAAYLRLVGYRLPAEAEWEYACRAGSTVGYSFGEPAELLEKYGWYSGNSLGQTHPQGVLKPNDLGLFDMHGNVWQWTQDEYKEKVAETEDDRGGFVARASYRVDRGGSWNNVARFCRAAFRNELTPVFRPSSLGFRLARVPVEAGGKYAMRSQERRPTVIT